MKGMLKRNLKKLTALMLVFVMTIVGSVFCDLSTDAASGHTKITGNPKILFYEVPPEFVDGEKIRAPRNTTFTLNANRDVIWSAEVNNDTSYGRVTIDPLTGVVKIPYDAKPQSIKVMAISNDGESVSTTFLLEVTEDVATIKQVEFNWDEVAENNLDENGNKVINYDSSSKILSVSGNVKDVTVTYNVVEPYYINDKRIKIEVKNNENIEFKSIVDGASIFESQVYDYSTRMKGIDDPDGYITMNTMIDGHYKDSSQSYSLADVCCINEQGKYENRIATFIPQVQNVPLHFFVEDSKTEERVDSNSLAENEYKTIALNANNELSLSIDLAEDISWYDEEAKKIVDKEKTLSSLKVYYCTGEVYNSNSAKEVCVGEIYGNLGFENVKGTYPTVDASYLEQYGEIDPFQRKLQLSRLSDNEVSIKTPLAVPNISQDVTEIKTVWLRVEMTPMDSSGFVVADGKEVLTYRLMLNLDKEEPTNPGLYFEELITQGKVCESQKKFNGETVWQLAGNMYSDLAFEGDGKSIVFELGDVKFDTAKYMSLSEFYNVDFQLRKAESLEELKSSQLTLLDTDYAIVPISNELGYYELTIEITANEIGNQYELVKEPIKKTYYFESIPNIKYVDVTNPSELSDEPVVDGYYSVADTDGMIMHAMIGQKLTPDYKVSTFYDMYECGFGTLNENTLKSSYGDYVDPYIQKGLIKFYSLDTNVATVDENGTITAKQSGTTYVMAYTTPAINWYANKKLLNELGVKTYEVDYKYDFAPVSSLYYYDSPMYIKLVVGQDAIKLDNIKVDSTVARNNTLVSLMADDSLSVKGKTSFNLGITTAPLDAATPNVTWSSSDMSIATVDPTTGEVNTKKAGTVTITAVLNSDTAITASQTIIVEPVVITEMLDISVDTTVEGHDKVLGSYNIGTVDVGTSFGLKVTTNPVNATEDGGITWESSDPAVASVDENGVVTALSDGTTIIKAYVTSNPVIYKEYSLTVNQPKVEGMLGDIDNSGEVILLDAQICLKAALGIQNLDEKGTMAADVDENGTVNLEDAQQILKYALGIITVFEKAA